MNISNIKELSKLIDLCRKKGIEAIEIDNIKLKLGAPKERKRKPAVDLSVPELADDPIYSSEDILNWSSSQMLDEAI